MYFISGIKGAIFVAIFVVLVFFLKIICPIYSGCLVDPFLVVLFSPLWLFYSLHLTFVSTSTEPYAILGFWALIGFIIGALLSPFFERKKASLSEREHPKQEV
jgi:membrane associated rhomboid family serine protease